MARPKEKEVVMTKQGKRTYRIDKDGKKLTWRPTKFTEDLTKKLEELFALDVPTEVACSQVGISSQALRDEMKRNPEFLARIEKAKNLCHVMAGRTIAKAIRDGDVQTSKRYYEHKDERYKKENKISLNANTETDPETWAVATWLKVEFEITE